MRLGKYEIQRELGRGAFGTVYLARDTVLDVPRALKVLHPALVVDAAVVERFHREARLAARLEHPHIVPVYDFGQAEGRFYLAMRYMEGGSLKERLAQGPLPWEEVVRVVQEVAAGLAYAHEQGVVHRDLKPGNILFDKDGRAVVTDFGLAKALRGAGSSASLTMSGGLIGTPAYMAPELWQGRPATPATDQYALACMVYEMVIGKALFGGDTPWEVMGKHREGPRFPERWPEGVPAGLEEVLGKALAQEPGERYGNIQAFVTALVGLGAAAVEEKPVQEEPAAEVQPEPTLPSPETNRSSAPEASPLSVLPPSTVSKPVSRHIAAEPKTEHSPQPNLRKTFPLLIGVLALLGVIVGGVIFGKRQETAYLSSTVKAPSNTEAQQGGTKTSDVIATKVPTITKSPAKEHLGTVDSPVIWVLTPDIDADETLSHAELLAEYVKRKTGIVIRPVIAAGYTEQQEALCSGEAQMATLSSFDYVRASANGCANVALVSVRYGSTSYQGEIITQAGSGIERVEDLTGKKFCRPDIVSTSGWVVPSLMMEAVGIDPETDLAEIMDTGGHGAVIISVYNGDCDAGASFVDARKLVERQFPDVMDKVVVIATSPAIPNDNISFRPDFPQDMWDKIVQALLILNDSDEGRNMLNDLLHWQGLEKVDDSLYDGVRHLLEASSKMKE